MNLKVKADGVVGVRVEGGMLKAALKHGLVVLEFLDETRETYRVNQLEVTDDRVTNYRIEIAQQGRAVRARPKHCFDCSACGKSFSVKSECKPPFLCPGCRRIEIQQRYAHPCPVSDLELREMYNRPMLMSEMKLHFGVSRLTINRWLASADEPIRTASERNALFRERGRTFKPGAQTRK